MNKVQLPFGMKDYLPDECYNKQCAESEMGNVFSSYGYKRVAMPALEYCDLFTADGSIPVNKLFKLTDTDGVWLALRGDATIQVCRMYVTSMTGLQRMYYSLDSFEYLRDTNSSRDREFAQTGIELIGESGEDGEVEVLSMAVDALRAAGLENFKIELGHVGFFEGLAESVGLDPASAAELKSIINKKDMLGVELFFSDRGLGDDAKEGILSLPSLFGDASVLERAAGDVRQRKEPFRDSTAVLAPRQVGLGGSGQVFLRRPRHSFLQRLLHGHRVQGHMRRRRVVHTRRGQIRQSVRPHGQTLGCRGIRHRHAQTAYRA